MCLLWDSMAYFFWGGGGGGGGNGFIPWFVWMQRLGILALVLGYDLLLCLLV